MRLLLPFISMLLLSFLTSCAPNASVSSKSPDKSNRSTITAAAQMPEARPADFAFSVRFGITGKHEINTFDGTVTKDLVLNGTAKAELVLTDSEMADIYARMRTINIYRELELEPDRKNCAKTPFDEEHWQIRMDGAQFSFDWDDEACETTKDAKQLKELRSYIFELVKTKQAYLELPEAVGGYD
ncbi:hypothetical protein [Paenibacillus sp. FSL R7-0331]|uniref:hypothetical protein n=1 Tax=Paenibacillus sp. FSL R7-0331 TaxID=1536773 RepID=UPI000693E02A|nr:hypothetical protein [Paenibacillus sp. FSL R7-0331]